MTQTGDDKQKTLPPAQPHRVRSSGRERPDPTDPTRKVTFDEELETALELSDDDIESIEMMEMSGEVEQAGDDSAAQQATAEPSIIVDAEPGTATWDDVSFFYREAMAIGPQQPERAGLTWYQAACSAQLARSPKETVLEYLRAALDQAPDNPSLISLVRRELVRLRQHDKVLALTTKLVQAGGATVERVSALIEAATIQRHVKNDWEAALELLRQALALQPGNVAALTMTALYQMEQSQHEGAAAALEQIAEVLGDPLDRSYCLHAAGTLRELRLEQQERAEQDYTRALELDPENLPAWIALSYHHLMTGAWRRLAADLEQIASLERGHDLRVGALLRAGVLQLHRNEDLDGAARIFSQAAEVATDTAPLTRLANVYEATGRVEHLVTTLRRLLQLTLDPTGQAVLLMRIGRLLEFQLHRQDEAIGAYRQVLEARPGYFPALQALGAIFRRQGDFESLLEILLPETEGTGEPARRAMRCVEVGGILADRLQRHEEAIGYYRRALELDPNLRMAAWRLGALFLGQRRFVELAKLLEWQIELTTDEQSRFHLLVELARVQRGPLQASQLAVATLKRAWSIGQNRIAAMDLIELHEEIGNYSELVELLLWEAGQTNDLAEATWRRIQAAMALEDRLEEHDRALAIFWEVLNQVPTCVGAVRAAGQIYYAHGRWQELIKLHLHELDHEPEVAENGEPWCRIGRIYEENLGLFDEAIEAYKKALALDSSSTVALDALERLIRIEQRHDELVPVLERYGKRRRDPHAATDILCRAAELAEARLGDAGRAAQLYQDALALHPDSMVALYGLSDLEHREGQFEAACGTLQRLIEGMGDPESRYLLMLQQARLREFRLGEIDPSPYDLAAQLPKLAARLRLDQIRTRLPAGDPHVAGALLVAGASTADNMLGAALLVECGLRSEWRQDHDAQREASDRALARNREDLAATWCLQRVLRATGHWARLAALIEAESAKHTDPTIRISLLAHAAQAHLAANSPTEGARLSSQCLTVDKQHLPSIRCLIQLATDWQNYTELASLYDQLAASCADRANRLQASLLAADCWADYVGDPVNALASLKRILAEDPQQADAFARAWRLLSTLGDFGQLSQLYARRIAACGEPEEKVQLLRQHVRILRDELGDTPGAIAELNTLLELDPDDLDALKSLADLSRAAQRWSDAADALARLAQRTKDTEQRQSAWVGHADIALKQLQKPRQALSILRHVLQEVPGNLEAKRLLVEVHVEEGQWDEAQQLLEEISADADAELRVWALIQQAEVARVGLRDEGLQERYEREVLSVASEHPALLDQLVEHYRTHRRQRRLLEMASRMDSSTNQSAMARLRLVMARLLLEDFNQPDKAIEYLRESLTIDPKNIDANLLMGEALEHRGEIEGAVESYRKLLLDDPRCVEAYRGLNRLMGVLGKPALATAAASLLDVMGVSSPTERGQARALDQLGIPPGTLPLSALPLRPMLSQVSQVLELVAPHLGSVYQTEPRLLLEEGAPAVLAANQIGRVLGLSDVRVSIEGSDPAQAGIGSPVLLQVTDQVARQPKSGIFRFWVGRALVLAAAAGGLIERLTNRELDVLVEALFATRPGTAAQQLRKQLGRVVPRKVRKQLEPLRLEPVDDRLWDRYRADEQRRADQIGLLICGNPRVAVGELAATDGLLGRSTRARELMIFAVSDRYAVLHDVVWRPRRAEPSG